VLAAVTLAIVGALLIAPVTSVGAAFTLTGKAQTAETAKLSGQAKYVFVFIGDGVGVAQRTAAELYLATTQNPDVRPEKAKLIMNTFPVHGMNTTGTVSFGVEKRS
jgi:alkaline phosphatase